jgi:hypothetical protein
MPSGLKQILPGMRISGDALRVSALVAAGVASGYLWRAAFEPDRAAQVVAVPTPITSVEPFVRPALTPAPAHASKPAARRVRSVARRPRGSTARRTTRISRPAPVAQTPGVGGRPGPSRPSPPKPPAPAPTPRPVAPVGSPPSAAPAVTSPPAPTVVAVPGNPRPRSPATPPSGDGKDKQKDKDKGEGDRPGWGHGDDNHSHEGPGKKSP